MNDEQTLKQALQKRFGTQSVRCCRVSQMWIIELIVPGLDQAQRHTMIQDIQQVLAQTLQGNQVIWKRFLYSDPQQRFNVDGTLHTHLPTYSPDGVYTTTLAAGDCFVWLTEYDGEALQLGTPFELKAIEAVGQNGQPILGYTSGATYVRIETLGRNFAVAQNGVAVVANTQPKELEITLT